MARVKFDWDKANLAKCTTGSKPGDLRVPKDEIEEFLSREDLEIAPDPCLTEIRFQARGIGKSGRPVFVVFTIRKIDDVAHIRPVSVRYAHKKEASQW